MAKITLRTASSGYQTTADLNQNFSDISSEFQNKVLYRVNPAGEPNQMENDLDMNSFKILNVKDGSNTKDGINYGQLQGILKAVATGTVVRLREPRITSTANQTVFNLTSISYITGINALQVFINGVAQLTGADFTETNSTTITFTSGLQQGDEVDVYAFASL